MTLEQEINHAVDLHNHISLYEVMIQDKYVIGLEDSLNDAKATLEAYLEDLGHSLKGLRMSKKRYSDE